MCCAVDQRIDEFTMGIATAQIDFEKGFNVD